MTLLEMQDQLINAAQLQLQNTTTMRQRICESFTAWYQALIEAQVQANQPAPEQPTEEKKSEA